MKDELGGKCLEAIQLENKINQIEKNNIDIASIKENHEECKRAMNQC